MRLIAFSVFDAKAEAFLRPFFAETRGLALRSFRDAANDASSEMCKHAEDYTLFHIGVFHLESAKLEACVPESLGNALTFKESLK